MPYSANTCLWSEAGTVRLLGAGAEQTWLRVSRMAAPGVSAASGIDSACLAVERRIDVQRPAATVARAAIINTAAIWDHNGGIRLRPGERAGEGICAIRAFNKARGPAAGGTSGFRLRSCTLMNTA